MAQIIKKYDDYIRPNITYTDTLTKKEIIDFLQDFEKITDLDYLPLGTYISYIDVNDKNIQFRIGGSVIMNKPDFMVLSGGKSGFSVQKKNKIFFKRLNYYELKTEMEKHIQEYKYIVNQKDRQIKELILYIKKLKKP